MLNRPRNFSRGEISSLVGVSLIVDPLVDVDYAPDVVANRIHIVREAIANGIRQANASHVQITLEQLHQELVLV